MRLKQTKKVATNKLDDYLKLSRSVVSKPVPHVDKVVGASMALALFGALQTVEAQMVYSGPQNVPCNLTVANQRCYANIDLAGGNDFEITRNVVAAQIFVQVDEVPGGGFEINGFNAQFAGGYVYPYALAAGALIGPASPWFTQAGQANSLSDNGFYPNHKWESLPNGTTRFLGIRGTIGGQTKYGWIRLTKNGFSNYTIVDWAYNNTTNGAVLAGNGVATSAGVSVSGRVLTSDGRGLRNAVVTLTDVNGNVRTARTSAFGYYQIDEIPTGQTVVVGVQSKLYQFAPRTLTVGDAITDLDFIGSN
ncbi:MAG TPA: carboxypeptidase-like regulatory domain-containing protein [Pyrinomonadaceae bacterium]|nr:carboxypeptidase-like regulatory domain-containing protein [Pyrinomonadaceae bacterium]